MLLMPRLDERIGSCNLRVGLTKILVGFFWYTIPNGFLELSNCNIFFGRNTGI